MLQRGNTAWTLPRPGLPESQIKKGTAEKGTIPFLFFLFGRLMTGRRSVRAALPRWSVGTIKVFLEKGGVPFCGGVQERLAGHFSDFIVCCRAIPGVEGRTACALFPAKHEGQCKFRTS